MKKKAVIDRFEGKQAIILVDEKPLTCLKSELPIGIKEGDWLEVEIDEERLLSAKIDPEEKAKATERITEKLARLRKGDHLK